MRATSILSPGLFKNGLKRFWPLWLVGLLALVMGFDVPVYTTVTSIAHTAGNLQERVNMMGEVWWVMRAGAWFYALVGSIVAALVLNEHLFDGRAATFVGSLPVRRRTVFVTNALLGLVVLVVLPVLAAAFLLPLYASLGSYLSLDDLGQWLGVAIALSFVFYALAQLSCHLSGTRAVALLLYAVINVLAVCLEFAGSLLVSALVYGIPMQTSVLTRLSPAVWLGGVAIGWGSNSSQPLWGDIVAYVAAAVIVLVLACCLYERRELEKAGDSISFVPLRPVLKYLAGVSLALLFGTIYRLLSIFEPMSGLPMTTQEVLVLSAMLAIGGFLGVLFAEMIMSRSARVLARCWRGGLALVVVALAFVGACRFDALGVARAVPEAGDVEEVELSSEYSWSDLTISSPEGIADVCDLHRSLVSFGGQGDRGLSYLTIRLAYRMKDGRAMMRTYPVPSNFFEVRASGAAPDQGAQILESYERIADGAEGRAARFAKVLDAQKDDFYLELEYLTSDGQYDVLKLNDAERDDLLAGALRADLMEERAGEVFGEIGAEAVNTYDARLVALRDMEATSQGEYEGSVVLLSLSPLSEERTPHVVSWLREHHPEVQLEPMEW